MKTLPTKVTFDGIRPALEELVRDWAEREWTTFDEAVRRAAGLADEEENSIWDMPRIDSKCTVSLLVELEPVLGCKLPVKLIKPGGYDDADELLADLMAGIRKLCPDAKTEELEMIAVAPSTQV